MTSWTSSGGNESSSASSAPYSSQRAPPARFARYIAASASCSSCSGCSPSRLTASPMLAVTFSPPACSGGWSREPSSRSARATGSPSWTPMVSIRNSSPANRATVSPGRTTEDSRAATSRSSRSPALWPRVSLTLLNPSRSMKYTAMGRPERAAPARDCSSRSRNSVRFGSPVSGSCNVRWVSRCSASWRWPLTLPSSANRSVSSALRPRLRSVSALKSAARDRISRGP